jgi:hypothetical protein
MNLKSYEFTGVVDLPWPQVWTAMSWEISQWVSCNPDTACVKVSWNEDLLTRQVDSNGFHLATHEIRQALELVLGPRLDWQIQRSGEGQSHTLIMSDLSQ